MKHIRHSRWKLAAVVAALAVLAGSVALANAYQERTITVVYRPMTFVVDGVPKTPPANAQPFIYEGTTYVPLRFLSEALGKAVEWDGETGTIYIGRRPGSNRPGAPLDPGILSALIASAL